MALCKRKTDNVYTLDLQLKPTSFVDIPSCLWCVYSFQPGNFTGWSSEGVKHHKLLRIRFSQRDLTISHLTEPTSFLVPSPCKPQHYLGFARVPAMPFQTWLTSAYRSNHDESFDIRDTIWTVAAWDRDIDERQLQGIDEQCCMISMNNCL